MSMGIARGFTPFASAAGGRGEAAKKMVRQIALHFRRGSGMENPMSRHFLVALSLFLLAIARSGAQSAPDGMQLFLLIGQSNMAGRGKVEPQDEATNPRIFMLTKERAWVPARDPVHFDKPVAGVGLCSEFARVLVKADAKITVGLVPCAVGGTSLDQWKPGGKLYNEAVARAREAMKKGTLTGILWHQGEADSAHEKVATYGERFAAMIAQLRKDLGEENVPVMVGELGRFRAASTEFNEALPDVVKRVPRCALVSAEGLVANKDQLHFDAPSLRTFGTRYAEAFQKLRAAAK
jgi:Carbohydrate esterase, sialic acid-specific acetylesterase